MTLFCRSLALFLTLTLLMSPGASQANTMRRPSESYQQAFEDLRRGRQEAVRAAIYQGSNPALNKVLEGSLMALPGNDYSYEEIATFVNENPDWPNLSGILMIAEQKIPANIPPQSIVKWYDANTPLTAYGFNKYIEALQAIGEDKRAVSIIRKRWIEKDLSADEATAFASRYATVLRKEDHVARLDRLLWDDKTTAAKKMYTYVGAGHKALAEARMALASGKSKGLNQLLAQVPSSLSRDPGLLFERFKWRRKADDDRGALEILLNAPKNLGRPEAWWPETNIIIRRLMEKKDFTTAYKLASNTGLTSGFEFVQAEFIAGWLALRFMKTPTQAYQHFMNLLNDASSPISRARGYYWLGRAYESVGQTADARQAYQEAATLSSTFYGQLAMARLDPNPIIRVSPEPAIPDQVKTAFEARASVQAVRHLFRIGEVDRAYTFFKAIADNAQQRYIFALLTELAYQLGRPDWAITSSKAASQKHIILSELAYPVLAMTIPSPPEQALSLALIRQESQFKVDAGSPVGARGLMQLMPATAKETAKKLGMTYHPERLSDPSYNVRLGTHYFQRQIDNFDGSYVLALAGYNAGPGRAREWMRLFGDPRSQQVDVIDWIELIPIYETRNYIHRILENVQIYRARLNKREAPLLIEQDLKR